MRKALFLSTSFSTGGGERIFSMLYRHFSRVSVFLSFEEGCEYIGVCNRAVSLLPYCIKNRIIAMMACFFAYLSVIRRYRPEVVQSHIHMPNVFNVLGSLVYRYESQVVVHGFLSQYLGSTSISKKLWGYALCFIYRRADVVIAVSKGVEVELHSLGIIKTKLIYNAVESSVNCRERVVCSSSFRLLFAGRLHKVKKVDVIIRALAKVEGVHLTIAGLGSEMSCLQALVEELGIRNRVKFLGFVEDLEMEINQCDGLVLSSEVETFGLCLVEALLAGRPVISSNCDTGPREVFNMVNVLNGSGIVKCSGYGLLYDVGSVSQLAECIENLRAEYSYYVPDVNVVAKRFSSSIMLQEYESILE